MKNKLIIILIITLIILIFSFPLIILQIRKPVLIVTEESFINLYGKERIKNEAFRDSIKLFRKIKTVAVANDAAEDIIALAVSNVSLKPHCVLFPSRFAASAAMYHQQNADIKVILLEGRNNNNLNIPEIFKYKTDIESDFFNIGVLASVFELPKENPQEGSPPAEEQITLEKTVVLFIEPSLNNNMGGKIKNEFQKGLQTSENQPKTLFYNSFSEYPENSRVSALSCAVLAGTAYEFLEKYTDIPVFVYTWLDPFYVPSNSAVIINDSPWAQVVQAVKTVETGAKTSQLKSKFIILDKKKIDNDILKKIK